MARQKNDGKGRLGGRQKGTTNKDKPLKAILAQHSLNYFSPTIPAEQVQGKIFDEDWKTLNAGKVFSQFEIDCLQMKASERARCEIDVMSYHSAKMQAISADMAIKEQGNVFTDRLARLANGEEIAADEEE